MSTNTNAAAEVATYRFAGLLGELELAAYGAIGLLGKDAGADALLVEAQATLARFGSELTPSDEAMAMVLAAELAWLGGAS